jgi:hypothetical protein
MHTSPSYNYSYSSLRVQCDDSFFFLIQLGALTWIFWREQEVTITIARE